MSIRTEIPARAPLATRRRALACRTFGTALALGLGLGSVGTAHARAPRSSAGAPTTTVAKAAPVHDGFDPPAPTVTRRDKSGRRAEARRKYPHRGTVIEATIGPLGCDGALCGGLDAQPGYRVGGFFGGNIHGYVEMGVTGGWGTMQTRTAGGMDPLSMYGLDVSQLQSVLSAAAALGYTDINLEGYTVSGAALQTAQVGPLARLHFNPKGRLMVWAGGGATYHLLRNDFATDRGRVRMDTHGLSIPVEGGIGMAVHEHFAVVATGSYMWTRPLLSGIDLPDRDLMVPTKMLQRQAQSQGGDLVGKLPNFWTVSAGIRTRF